MKTIALALTAIAATSGIAIAQHRPQSADAIQPIAPAIAQSEPAIEGCSREDWQLLMLQRSDGPASAGDISGGTNHPAQANLIGDIEGYGLIAYLSTRENIVRVSVVHPPGSDRTQSFLTPDIAAAAPGLEDCAAIGRDVLRNALAD